MDRLDFVEVMAMLSAGIGKPMADDQLEVYFDLLGDLPVEVLRMAAKTVLLEHRYSTIPTIAELRQLATEIMHPELKMDAGEAIRIARLAIREYGYMRPIEGLASLPPMIAEAVSRIGWVAFCDSENQEALRAHFTRIYDGLKTSTTRTKNTPAAITAESERLIDMAACGMKGIR